MPAKLHPSELLPDSEPDWPIRNWWLLPLFVLLVVTAILMGMALTDFCALLVASIIGIWSLGWFRSRSAQQGTRANDAALREEIQNWRRSAAARR